MKQRGMHRIFRQKRIVDHEDAGGTFGHVRGIAVACGEIETPRRKVASIPAGDSGIERGARADGKDNGTRCTDGKGAGGIARSPGAKHQNTVEIFKERIVNEAVKVAIDGRVTEPRLAIRDALEAQQIANDVILCPPRGGAASFAVKVVHQDAKDNRFPFRRRGVAA
jgi:hypothetical protein